MKRILSIFCTVLVCVGLVFAAPIEEQNDSPPDDIHNTDDMTDNDHSGGGGYRGLGTIPVGVECSLSYFHNAPQGDPCNIVHNHDGIKRGCYPVPYLYYCTPQSDLECMTQGCPSGC